MKDTEEFIKAYHEFKESVDFTKSGFLPELDDLVWCMLMGVPHVPGDEKSGEDAKNIAINQRVAILKAVFVELNKEQSDDFLSEGMNRYDEAGNLAKILIEKSMENPGRKKVSKDSNKSDKLR